MKEGKTVVSVPSGAHLSPADVQALDYVSFLSLVGETNRCQGGWRTIRRIVADAGLRDGTSVLEIGASTGFTSTELTLLSGCTSVGIDVNEPAIEIARQRARDLPSPYSERVSFEVGNASAMRFEDGTFDVVVSGGAHGFIADKDAALSECRRVLRDYGVLVVTSLYTASPQPRELLAALADTLGFEVEAHDLDESLSHFVRPGWRVLDCTTHPVAVRPAEVVDEYARRLTDRWPHAAERPDTLAAIRERWTRTMHVFNEGQRYLRYFHLVLRKEDDDEPTLFLDPGEYDAHVERAFVGPDPESPPVVS